MTYYEKLKKLFDRFPILVYKFDYSHCNTVHINLKDRSKHYMFCIDTVSGKEGKKFFFKYNDSALYNYSYSEMPTANEEGLIEAFSKYLLGTERLKKLVKECVCNEMFNDKIVELGFGYLLNEDCLTDDESKIKDILE